MSSVAIYGDGQLGNSVAGLLRRRGGYEVRGPFGRDEVEAALDGGADVVVIATTTLLRDVAADIRRAVEHGSNVLVSAEEAANPFLADATIAADLHECAMDRGVSIAGAGVNPGLIFDGLVVTLLGAAPEDVTIRVRRTVDISGFGDTVRRRIGVGVTLAQFTDDVESGAVLGHAGFPQSMSLVADAIGLTIDRIERSLEPVMDGDLTAGVNQVYVAVVDGRPWFTASFYGHVDLPSIGRSPSDDIEFYRGADLVQAFSVRPGFNAQVGSANMVANSVDRIIAARPGWRTIVDLPPAAPVHGRASFEVTPPA
jgi:4-hydroxy-tetrahydrodipicolinate reductase